MPLRRYVLQLTGDDEFARDVVQESMLRVWKNPGILEQGVVAARAWIYTVAHNIVIDDRRSARARREVRSETLPERERSDPTESALDTWLVTDALVQLTPAHRAVILRAYYLGQSVAELAEDLEIPQGTVRSRLHYGLRALRLALRERGVTGR